MLIEVTLGRSLRDGRGLEWIARFMCGSGAEGDMRRCCRVCGVAPGSKSKDGASSCWLSSASLLGGVHVLIGRGVWALGTPGVGGRRGSRYLEAWGVDGRLPRPRQDISLMKSEHDSRGGALAVSE